MFRESLLESSPAFRRPSGWPMAAGFTLQAIGLSAVVIVPLLFTGVIPIAAHPKAEPPITIVDVVDHKPQGQPGNSKGVSAGQRAIVRLVNTRDKVVYRDAELPIQNIPVIGSEFDRDSALPKSLVGKPDGNRRCVPHESSGRKPPVSVARPAELLKRIDPVYPHIATASGISGEVKLHAIISKEGTIESLSVISGHPLLAGAAVEAVKQWVYRPYILNGEKVEVETFIFVNFKKTGQ